MKDDSKTFAELTSTTTLWSIFTNRSKMKSNEFSIVMEIAATAACRLLGLDVVIFDLPQIL
jgi:hypothetical protein